MSVLMGSGEKKRGSRIRSKKYTEEVLVGSPQMKVTDSNDPFHKAAKEVVRRSK